MRTILVCLALALLASAASSTPRCIDESGSTVDWWILIKIPTIAGSKVPQANGYGYLYADANSQSLSLSSKYLNVDATETALGRTLAPIYKSSTDIGYLMYNDEDPSGAQHTSNGHTKGELVFSDYGGYWLVHSVPRWPAAPPSAYDFPAEEKTYGQSMLCISLDSTNLEKVAGNFLLNRPYIYSQKVSSTLSSKYPNVAAVLAGKWVTTASSTTVAITSYAGHSFQTFAKNHAWNQTLSEDLVDPFYHTGFLWETWQNGATSDKMPSFCPPHYKYADVNIANITSNGMAWRETNDHSKWGISSGGPEVVCIGDINRQWSQNLRGGGTVCMENSAIHSTFNSLVSGTEACSRDD